MTGGAVPDIAHAIQLAVAPVFLLTGIASLLGVMMNRLARIIDRARSLEERWPSLQGPTRDRTRGELRGLERRRVLASRAITACTLAALMMCLVVATLFVEAMVELRLRWVIGTLFTLTMLALIAGLSDFLREVYLANRSVRILIASEEEASASAQRAN